MGGPTLAGRHEDDERRDKVLDYIIYVLVAVVVAVGAIGVHDCFFTATGVEGQTSSVAAKVTSVVTPPFEGRQRVRVLLMGADKRPGDAGRSDTMMVLTINPRTKRAAVLGIPRDLKWDIPDHGRDKINHSYHYGGIELTKETIEDIIGAPIDYYALVYFHGFVKVVDKLGGVSVDVPDIEGEGRGMNYDEGVVVNRTHIDHDGYLHLHLKPGWQKLDGAGALGFVRYRKSTMYHGAGDSDYARSGRQQQLLKGIAQQHLRITNIDKLADAAGEMRNHFTTNMEWHEIYDMLRVMKEVDPDGIWTGTVPIEDDPNFFHGGTYYAFLLEGQFREMKGEMERHLNGLATNLGDIQVLNASGLAGQAGDAAERLAAKGFRVPSVKNADTYDAEETLIYYTEGHKPGADLARSVLACGELIEVDTDDEKAPKGDIDIRVELGPDYDPEAAAVTAGEAQ